MKGRILIICSAAAVCLGAATLPAAAENESAHRESKLLRHKPMYHHHKNRMFRRDKR